MWTFYLDNLVVANQTIRDCEEVFVVRLRTLDAGSDLNTQDLLQLADIHYIFLKSVHKSDDP